LGQPRDGGLFIGRRRIEMWKKSLSEVRKGKGQSLLEFALIVPILCLITMGIIDFGWILHRQLTLDHATREGARRGAVGVNSTQVKQVVCDSVYFDLTPDQVQVSVIDPNGNDVGNPDNRTPDNRVVVEVTLNDVQLLTPLRNLVASMGTINLTSRSEFLIE
jgi:Flp pilus assembly protein TadG